MSISPGEWMGDWGVLDCRLQIADCRSAFKQKSAVENRQSNMPLAAVVCDLAAFAQC